MAERNVEIVGGAVRRLGQHDPQTADRLTDRGQMIGFRNVLVHACDVVDPDRVWRTIRNSLPLLLAEVDGLPHEAEGEEPQPGATGG